MNIFVYKLRLNEKYHDFAAWDAKVQEVFGKHAEFLRVGAESGKILVVGRTDTELKDNFGIAVFKAEDLDEARRFMESDPVIEHGIMSADVFPFKLFVVTDEAKKHNLW